MSRRLIAVAKQIRGVLLLAALLAAGCSAQTPPATAVPSPEPTATALPTTAPSPTLAAMRSVPTRLPTATATPVRRQADVVRLPSATPSATPIPGIACTTTGGVNLREGPGTAFRAITTLPGGTKLSALKQTTRTEWLLVSTPEDSLGWLYAPLVQCNAEPETLPVASVAVQNATPTATVRPTATATAGAPPAASAPDIPTDSWRGEYFDNASLLGQPVLVRNDPDLNFNWILDSPGPGIPADNFSARWTRRFNFPTRGDYRFFANADDGIRVYVDGWLVIDAWHTVIPVDYTGAIANIEPGLHTVTVEYFESGGHAHVRVWGEETDLVNTNWLGEYYPNPYLQEPWLFTRENAEIDFDWGGGSPDSRLSSNNFSVRWTKKLFFDSGDYKFFAETQADDWVKVSIDGWTVIEEYRKDGGREEGFFSNLGGGFHTVEVEYQDHAKKARIKVWWERQ